MNEQTRAQMTFDRKDEAVTVSLSGRISEEEALQLEKDLLGLCEDGAVKIVIDLSEVALIGSAGLGAFMAALKACRPLGGYVRLVGPQPLVRQVLLTTKLNRLFGLFETVEEARAAT